MSLEVFKMAVDIAYEFGDPVVLGGGEPTLHPDVITMIGYATLMAEEDFNPFMVTNGTCKEDLWNVLVRAKERGNLALHVSKDPWHNLDLISPWVSRDAEVLGLWWGNRDRRTISLRGRALRASEQLKEDATDWGYSAVDVVKEGCSEVRVDPNGIVWIDVGRRRRLGRLSSGVISLGREMLEEYESRA
jgi:hypothetical protein